MAGCSDPFVLITVGSDHHPFPRLLDWVATWQRGRPDIRVVAQHGPAGAPPSFEGQPFLEHADLVRLMEAATVVVTHGGPTSIIEARRHGHIPIAVPRRRRLGEVVDDHQVGFCTRIAELDDVVVVTDADALSAALDAALDAARDGRRPAATDHTGSDVAAAVAQFAELVDGLLVRDAVHRRRDRGRLTRVFRVGGTA